MSPGLDADKINCYAIRRVNPFLGVLQIVETSFGKATSTNGLDWDIEICDKPDSSPLSETNELQPCFYPYGRWSADRGLYFQHPACRDNTESQAQLLTDRLRGLQSCLPFKLIDCYEYWLHDKYTEKPLVMLESATSAQSLAESLPRYWRGSQGYNAEQGQVNFPAADELEFLVKERAGYNPRIAWYQRNEDGTGIELETESLYSKDSFPVCLIDENWEHSVHYQLVQDYLAWIAPALLTLPLPTQHRLRLEQVLHLQAISIEHHWRLYPQILDTSKLTAARVQSRLQHADIN